MGNLLRALAVASGVIALAASASSSTRWVQFDPVREHAPDREATIHRAAVFLVSAGYDVEAASPGVLYTEWRAAGAKETFVRWSVAVDHDGEVTVDVQCRTGGRSCAGERPATVDWSAEASALAAVAADKVRSGRAPTRPAQAAPTCYPRASELPACFANRDDCEVHRDANATTATGPCALSRPHCFRIDNGRPNCFDSAERCDEVRARMPGPTTTDCKPQTIGR